MNIIKCYVGLLKAEIKHFPIADASAQTTFQNIVAKVSIIILLL